MNDDPVPNIDLHSIGAKMYVILMKDTEGHLTLLVDPGLNRPAMYKNKRLADFHAHNCDGEARTWNEAFNLLVKAYPNFEKELVERVRRVQAASFSNSIKKITPNGTN